VTVRINLALQGGGAHGAFTWGVLDRLLDEDEIEVAALSGTSAGALNAAAFKSGMVAGGREGARAALDALWAEVGTVGDLRLNAWMRQVLPLAAAWNEAMEDTFAVSPQGIAAQVFSPYAYGPMWANPLDRVVRQMEFAHICDDAGPRLFIGATNVRTGKIKVFTGHEVSPEVLLASSCLPTVFQAVEVKDAKTGVAEAYWDGGYTGNPALFPLYVPHLPDDIVIVSINPLRREDIPRTPLEIQNRINEVSFNASLLGELRAVQFVKRLIADGKMAKGQMKDVLIHMIADDALMTELSATTKLLPTPALLARLKAAGRAAAAAFLQGHRGDLGRRASVNLRELFS
jgi:NTE family protein